MKPFITVLAAGTLAAAAAVTSFAFGTGNSTEKIKADLTLLTNGELTSVHFSPSFEEDLSEKEGILYRILENGVSSFERRLNISEAGYTDPDELSAFIEKVFNTKLLWNGIDDTVTYTVTNGIITHLSIDYTTPERNITALSDYTPTSDAVNHALADIRNSMTDVEKALLIHDYLVREVDYDLDVANDLEGSPDVYTLKGVFEDRNAVCQGYALAYSYLLSEVGIESIVLSSKEMNHAWNLVDIDGTWYHVDVTWDDPTNGDEVDSCRGGYVRHKYFLRSDKEMTNELEHYGWIVKYTNETAPKANVSNAFDGWSFRPMINGEESDVGILNYVDGYYYYLDSVYGSSTMVRSTITGANRTEFPLPRDYQFMFAYNGKLYANTTQYISELSLTGKENRIVAASSDYIRNFWLKQDTLAYYEINENGVAARVEVDLQAGATNRIEEGYFVYVIDRKGEATLVEYKGGPCDVLTIPEKVGNYTVTAIGSSVFRTDMNNRMTINKVVLPNTIKSIGAEAFMYSTIEEINLPDSLTSIGEKAFFNCNNFSTFSIPKNVTEIGRRAFYACYALEEICFYGDVPTSWGEEMFGKIENQVVIRYAEDTKGWTKDTWLSPDGVTYRSSTFSPVFLTIEENNCVYTLHFNGEATLVEYKGGPCDVLTIPDNIMNYPVTAIGDGVFKTDMNNRMRLYKVVLPNSIKSIGIEAFMYSTIREINLSDSLTSIGARAFFNCNNFEEFTIPKNVKEIGQQAFYACYYLEDIYFCGDVPAIWGAEIFGIIEDEVEINFLKGRSGWTEGTWTDPNGVTYESESFGKTAEDLNKDGIVNGADAAYLAMYFKNPTAYPLPEGNLDCNNDGKTTIDDAASLLWSLFG